MCASHLTNKFGLKLGDFVIAKCVTFVINWNWYIYLCWRKLSWRLKYFPHTSQAYVNSGLLWVRSCIIKLYGLVKRRWQNLHTNSHFGRILRRKSDRRSSLSIRITANILSRWKNWWFFWLFHTLLLTRSLSLGRSSWLYLDISTHSLKSRNYVWVNILRFCSFCNPSRMYIQFLLCTMSLLYGWCRDSVDERKVKKGVKIVCFYLNCFNLFFLFSLSRSRMAIFGRLIRNSSLLSWQKFIFKKIKIYYNQSIIYSKF